MFPDINPSARVSPEQLLRLASARHGGDLSMHTLRTWRRRIGVSAGGDRCYSINDVSVVLEFIDFRKRGFNSAQFNAYKNGDFVPADI